ncbi:PcfJ domain-containing protein [Candidatus Uabimicrobium helgolandensis]
MSIYQKNVKVCIDSEIKKALASCQNKKQRSFFMKIITHVRQYSCLLRPQIRGTQQQYFQGVSFVKSLRAVISHRNSWINSFFIWKPEKCGSANRQFYCLLTHLFAKYPVPSFMMSIWFEDPSPDVIRKQNWFKHIGSGQNLRTVNDLPLRFTKKMSHYFVHAPGDLSINQALRWSQVRGMGGDEVLADLVVCSRIGNNFDNENFWEKLIVILCNSECLPYHKISEIIDYVYQAKFTDTIVLESNFSLKGQTDNSLLNKVNNWHRFLSLEVYYHTKYRSWKQSGINGYNQQDSTLKFCKLSIDELQNNWSLIEEGRKMRNCVANYIPKCLRGTTSIWSMAILKQNIRKRIMTIEIDNDQKLICQAKMKCNQAPDRDSLEALQCWADKEGLKVELQ